MPELDPLVLRYSHLRDQPREKDALHMLRKVASLVKPLMRQRGWKVGELGEFLPREHNLLGLNYDHGRRILLRLRYANDPSLFLPLEEVVDTMLHELSHIVIGPHNDEFHKLWDQLRDEHEALAMRGYTGEVFLSEGRRLGGRNRQPPMHEIRRLARAEAERRQRMPQGGTGGGRRLGGHSHGGMPSDMRDAIARAVEARNTVLQGCGADRDAGEMEREAQTASKNGFKTQAEEDAANEAAIAEALWEMAQEDQKKQYGDKYIPPTAANPAGNGGWSEVSQLSQGSGGGYRSTGTGGRTQGASASSPPPIPFHSRPAAESSSASSTGKWACKMCTLVNPATYLCCDACGAEKSADPAPTAKAKSEAPKKRPATSPLKQFTGSVPLERPKKKQVPWNCSLCGFKMEGQWFACSSCGNVKERS